MCKNLQNQVIAFAGGGITALSSPEKEWRETELKSSYSSSFTIKNPF